MAMLFGLPILASVVVVYFLSPEWYTKVSRSITQVTVTVIIAVILFMLFFSFTRMHFKWEMNEQLYQELKQNARRKMQRNQTNLNLK